MHIYTTCHLIHNIMNNILKKVYFSKRNFPMRAHSTEQTPFTTAFQPGTHLTAESTVAVHTDAAGFEPSISVSRNQKRLNHICYVYIYIYVRMCVCLYVDY